MVGSERRVGGGLGRGVGCCKGDQGRVSKKPRGEGREEETRGRGSGGRRIKGVCPFAKDLRGVRGGWPRGGKRTPELWECVVACC